MKKEKITLKNGETYLYKWDVKNPQAVFQLIHGSKEYIHRYDDFIKFLNKHKISVWGMDLRGHGEYALQHHSIGNMGKGDIKNLVIEDVHQVSKMIKKAYPKTTYIIFGHSMGSFIARYSAMQFPDAEKYIFCGTNHCSKLLSLFGILITNISTFFKGPKAAQKIDDDLSYKAFAKEFKDDGGNWLTSDKSKLPKGNKRLFRFYFNNATFEAELYWTLYITETKNIIRHPNVPTLFISGGDDPVGNFGKMPKKAYKKYLKLGKKVKIKIYPGMRHEILQEKENQKVYKDILNFIISK